MLYMQVHVYGKMITESAHIAWAEICPEWLFSIVTGVFFEEEVWPENMRVVAIDRNGTPTHQHITTHNKLVKHLPASPVLVASEITLLQAVIKQVVQLFFVWLLRQSSCL